MLVQIYKNIHTKVHFIEFILHFIEDLYIKRRNLQEVILAEHSENSAFCSIFGSAYEIIYYVQNFNTFYLCVPPIRIRK